MSPHPSGNVERTGFPLNDSSPPSGRAAGDPQMSLPFPSQRFFFPPCTKTNMFESPRNQAPSGQASLVTTYRSRQCQACGGGCCCCCCKPVFSGVTNARCSVVVGDYICCTPLVEGRTHFIKCVHQSPSSVSAPSAK